MSASSNKQYYPPTAEIQQMGLNDSNGRREPQQGRRSQQFPQPPRAQSFPINRVGQQQPSNFAPQPFQQQQRNSQASSTTPSQNPMPTVRSNTSQRLENRPPMSSKQQHTQPQPYGQRLPPNPTTQQSIPRQQVPQIMRQEQQQPAGGMYSTDRPKVSSAQSGAPRDQTSSAQMQQRRPPVTANGVQSNIGSSSQQLSESHNSFQNMHARNPPSGNTPPQTKPSQPMMQPKGPRNVRPSAQAMNQFHEMRAPVGSQNLQSQSQNTPPKPMTQARAHKSYQPQLSGSFPPQGQPRGPGNVPQKQRMDQARPQMQAPRGFQQMSAMNQASQMQQSRGPPVGPPSSSMMRPVGPRPQSVQQPQSKIVGQGANFATANIDPRCQCPSTFFSTTTSKFPNSSSLAAQAGIPIGAVVHPLADSDDPEDEVPIVNYGSVGIVRCKRCRAYMNPFVQWHENGRRWGCNICGCMNETPSQYYNHLDANGDRIDKMERPELSKGIIEIVAPGEYCVRPPQPPVYVFVIDVSQEAVRTGMLKVVVDTIKQNLDNLPGSPRTQIGFITYDIAVHFYNLRNSLSQPQMLVVSDIQELFLPVPDELLVNLVESRVIVETLLDSLANMHEHSSSVETALGPAIQAAFNMMSHVGGKMCIFQSKLPTVGSGKLEFRNNPRVLGTDKEHTLLTQASPFYKNKALEFSRMQIAVELFLTPSAYCDIATLSNLPKYTGGQLHYYPRFNSERNGSALSEDLARSLSRTTAWEAVLRIRASRGVRVTNFYGNFFLRGVDLLALPNCDADSTFGVEFVHEEKMVASGAVSVQMALLYTNSDGERRIRVSTNCIPVTSNIAELLNSAKQDEVTTLLSKQMVDNVMKAGFENTRRKIQDTCVTCVRAFRSVGAYVGGYGQQNTQGPLPGNLALLPLYTMSLQKSLAFRGGSDIGLDERASILHLLSRMPKRTTKAFIYPALYELHSMAPDCGNVINLPQGATPDSALLKYGDNGIKLPPMTGLSAASLNSQGAFLLDNGLSLYLWLGKALRPDFIQSLFGVPNLDGIDSGILRVLPTSTDNELKKRVCNIIHALRQSHIEKHLQLHVVKEGEPVEQRFRLFLVEDRAPFSGGSLSYQEYINHVAGLSQSAGYARRN